MFEAPSKPSQFALLDHFGAGVQAWQCAPRRAAARGDLSPRAPFGRVCQPRAAAADCLRYRFERIGVPGKVGDLLLSQPRRGWSRLGRGGNRRDPRHLDRGHVLSRPGARCFPVPSLEAAVPLAGRLTTRCWSVSWAATCRTDFELQNSPAELDSARGARPARDPALDQRHEDAVRGSASPPVPMLPVCATSGAQAEHLITHHDQVMLLAGESRGEFREEDRLCCGRIARRLHRRRAYEPRDSRSSEEIVETGVTLMTTRSSKDTACEYLAATGQIPRPRVHPRARRRPRDRVRAARRRDRAEPVPRAAPARRRTGESRRPRAVFVLRRSMAEFQHGVLAVARSAGRLGVPVYGCGASSASRRRGRATSPTAIWSFARAASDEERLEAIAQLAERVRRLAPRPDR